MVALNLKRTCLYCGEPTKRGKKGEHIVPEAIGGALTLTDISDREVCTKCNNGVLSQIDKELCSRSYLSIIASQQIDAHLWQAWDVDHASNNLLIEARPSWGDDEILNCLLSYPQITFELAGPAVRANPEEVQRFGQGDFAKALFKAVRSCFGRYRDGKKGAIHFERIDSGIIRDGYRLAPRIFTRHSMEEIAQNINKQSFILRFTNEEDKQFALHSLSQLGEGRELKGWTQKRSSYKPTISIFFNIGDALRALMKIGLNLIAAYCPNSPVDHAHFAHSIQAITGGIPIPPRFMAGNGFVHADDVRDIRGNQNEHSFRLVYISPIWHVFSSFFGGRIGSYVRLMGPNYEGWNCADIVAPINSKAWTIRTSRILPAMKVHVEWNDSRALTPSFQLQQSVSALRIDIKRMR
jgi:hypothetical protein